MLAAPHPNQVRSACERCRKQKLRCSRQNADAALDAAGSASCVRCTRLGLPCQSGTQRKVGRPTKRDHLARKVAATSGPAVPASSVVQVDSAVQMPLQSPLGQKASNVVVLRSQSLSSTSTPSSGEDDSADSGISLSDDMSGMSWLPMMDPSSPFDFSTLNIPDNILPTMSLPTFPMTQSLPLPTASNNVMTFATPDTHFETLSRINFDLHSTWDAISHQNVVITLETLVSGICGHLSSDVATGMKAMQTIIKASQEFLITIRALQKKLSDEASQLELSTPSQTSPPPARDSITLGSPTALLIISIFSQLCAHFDFIFTIVNTRLSDPTSPSVSPGDVFFADIQILDFPSLGTMFTELIRTVMAQILPILGFPLECSAPSLQGRQSHVLRRARPGLLKSGRWREVLNGELGGQLRNGWSMRPAQTLEMMEVARELLMEYALCERE